jgi:hypothetical protein
MERKSFQPSDAAPPPSPDPEGTIYRFQGVSFYLILDGLVRPLPQDDENHTTNLLFGTTFSKQPKDVADDPTTKYQTGDTFEHNSCLAQGFSELEIYLIGSQTETLKDSIGNPISVGFKRKINNLPTNKYGFDGGAVDQVNASLVDLLPNGKDING